MKLFEIFGFIVIYLGFAVWVHDLTFTGFMSFITIGYIGLACFFIQKAVDCPNAPKAIS